MVPAVKTRLLFRAPTIHGHNRRTGLPSRLPTRSTVTSTGCITNLHSSRGRSGEQRRTSRIRKGELTRRRSLAPVPAPLIISEGIYFFSSHPPPRGCVGAGTEAPPPYRWSSAIRGHHHFAGLYPSGHPRPSFPLAIPERRAQQAKRSAPPDRKSLQKRLEQFADNVNSHPDSIGRRIDLALQPTVRKAWSSLRTT